MFIHFVRYVVLSLKLKEVMIIIELILIAQLNTTPQGVNNNSSGNVTAPPNSSNSSRNGSQFSPPRQKFPGFEIERFPKQPSLSDYLEYQRRNGNNFGEPRPRIQRR